MGRGSAAYALALASFLSSSAFPQAQSTPPTAAPPASTPGTEIELRIGGSVAQAKLIRRAVVVYPPIAKTAHIQGTVVLRAIIAKDGTVKELTYVSGPPLLMRSAMESVKQWRYKPTLFNGNPVEVDTTVSVVFNLGAVSPSKAFPSSVTPIPIHMAVEESISGNTYTNNTAHFTLTVPENIKPNDSLAAQTPFGVGSLTSLEGVAVILFQRLPTADTSPEAFAKMMDARGATLFPGYQKLMESQINVDGRTCDTVTFRFDRPGTVGDVTVHVPMRSFVVLIPGKGGILVANYMTLDSLFDQLQPVFSKIAASYHSTQPDDISRTPPKP